MLKGPSHEPHDDLPYTSESYLERASIIWVDMCNVLRSL